MRHGLRRAPEPAFRPSAQAWSAHRQALATRGESLDAATASEARSTFGHDFSRVRIHRDANADRAASEMSARAYAWGEHVFLRSNEIGPRGPLWHELGHVAEQARQPARVQRSPADAPAPATYILAYGSGQLSPGSGTDHHTGGAARLAAEAKQREITARLGKAAPHSTIVLKYCPTEVELRAVLNARYAYPVKEVHIFSHGWQKGVNLGGPDANYKELSETPAESDERHLEKEDLGRYTIQWADDPTVVFYGCHTGESDGDVSIAQEAAEAWGVSVTGSTTYSHFEKGPFGMQQVPDSPGKMAEYMPSTSTIDEHIAALETLSAEAISLATKMGGILPLENAQILRATMIHHIEWLGRVLGNPRLGAADREAKSAKVARLVKETDAAIAAASGAK